MELYAWGVKSTAVPATLLVVHALTKKASNKDFSFSGVPRNPVYQQTSNAPSDSCFCLVEESPYCHLSHRYLNSHGTHRVDFPPCPTAGVKEIAQPLQGLTRGRHWRNYSATGKVIALMVFAGPVSSSMYCYINY